ncbi:hypothetical protein AB0B45_01645 [Nonomuraea sp. NPDC049152]|uniref:hypothetical protein n=1 Tax=Nonomuraea sp. NPDC049152 TaxID=3154350 RepID=UPI0033E33D50
MGTDRVHPVVPGAASSCTAIAACTWYGPTGAPDSVLVSSENWPYSSRVVGLL